MRKTYSYFSIFHADNQRFEASDRDRGTREQWIGDCALKPEGFTTADTQGKDWGKIWCERDETP